MKSKPIIISLSILLFIISLYFLRRIYFPVYTIPTSSSEDAIPMGSYCLVNTFDKSPKMDDLVVFNYPEGDTSTLEFSSSRSYYEMVRNMGREEVNRNYTIVVNSVSDKEDFVFRCVGLPNDEVEVNGGKLFVNKKEIIYDTQQKGYIVETNGTMFNKKRVKELGINDLYATKNGNYTVNAAKTEVEALSKFSNVVSIKQDIWSGSDPNCFPFDTLNYKWSRDYFGPVTIPKKGSSVELDLSNISLYSRIIHAYEGNSLEIKQGEIYINDEIAKEYTFKQDYFFVLGDNRCNAADSRYWGFLPEDHLIGKVIMVF